MGLYHYLRQRARARHLFQGVQGDFVEIDEYPRAFALPALNPYGRKSFTARRNIPVQLSGLHRSAAPAGSIGFYPGRFDAKLPKLKTGIGLCDALVDQTYPAPWSRFGSTLLGSADFISSVRRLPIAPETDKNLPP